MTKLAEKLLSGKYYKQLYLKGAKWDTVRLKKETKWDSFMCVTQHK